MIPKLKKHKKIIKIAIIILGLLIVAVIAYKLLFYSNTQNDLYGVRLRDIEENRFSNKEIKEVKQKVSDFEIVNGVKIEVKGRLIKFFVTFNEGVTSDDMKNKFNETLSFISDKVKGYYDITLYAIQSKEGKEYYPVIGYKHKNNTEISFEIF